MSAWEGSKAQEAAEDLARERERERLLRENLYPTISSAGLIGGAILGVSNQKQAEVAKHDPVNHPPYYVRAGIEAIDVIEAFDLNFRLANVIKYVLRHGHKGDALQDLQQARWYLDREIRKRQMVQGKERAP